MSYCRWSSMNWQCDVYVYEDVSGGWTTHVAGSRRLFGPIPDIMLSRLSMWMHCWSGYTYLAIEHRAVYPIWWRGALYRLFSSFAAFWHNKVHMGSLRLIPLRPIGLPFDAQSFNDPSPDDCADRLEALRAMGYKVPQAAIDALRGEVVAEP